MFKTKSEIDKHVGKLFMKARTETERNAEGFKIARLYYSVKAYDVAKVYLAHYLSDNGNDPAAWKLMAEICEIYEKNWSKAIDCYSKSYDLNEQDKRILLKICTCYLNLKDNFETNTAAKWLEKTVKHFPYEKQVIEFKERLAEYFQSDRRHSNDWETFLLNGLANSYYNEDLHLKLIKLYFKDVKKCFFKAVKHILSVEQKSAFSTSLTWYKNLIELIEQNFDLLKSKANERNQFEFINIVYLMLSYHQILTNLQQTNSENNRETLDSILQLFIKFDQNLNNFDKYLSENLAQPSELKPFLNRPYQSIAMEEIKANFHYICGLYVLRVNSLLPPSMSTIADIPTLASFEVDAQIDNYDYLSKEMLSIVCMANSSLLSKPNNKLVFQDNLDKLSGKLGKEAKDGEMVSACGALIKLAHRDSNWRFSVIGNWMKFQLAKSNDEINFFKQIKIIGKMKNVRKVIVDLVGLSGKLNPEESFVLNGENFMFKLDNEKFYVIDHLSLDYADKCTL